jgi:hypothetical protein
VKALMSRLAGLVMIFMFFAGSGVGAQERPERFQRREAPVAIPVTVFHSTQGANLPTAETLSKGELLFEISHRFLPAVADGADALWGFDGPVYNRFGLAYAVSSRMMVGVQRTNLHDNLELNAKARLWETRSEAALVMIGAMGGIAWNTAAPTGAGADDGEGQSYGQLMLNVLVGERLALGVVPTVMHNPVIVDATSENTFVLGGHAQLYLSQHASLLAEWIKSPGRAGLEHNSGTFGIELETGGHFFKVILTNQARMNPTQFLGGTPFEFKSDEWRVGFNVTRVIAF